MNSIRTWLNRAKSSFKAQEPMVLTFEEPPGYIKKKRQRRGGGKGRLSTNQFICEYCGLIFRYKYNLQLHKNKKHKGDYVKEDHAGFIAGNGGNPSS